MKAETQADHLKKMMQAKNFYPSYELTLPFFSMKRSALTALNVNDVLLVGLIRLELLVLKEKKVCAIAKLDKKGVEVIELKDEAIAVDTKKYETIKSSFGTLQSRKLEVGYRLDTLELDMEEVKLFIEDEKIAKGKLVTVNDELAILITKVDCNEK